MLIRYSQRNLAVVVFVDTIPVYPNSFAVDDTGSASCARFPER
jgi:hypothetical protein